MTHADIIRLAEDVPQDNPHVSYINTFKKIGEREIVALLCAWVYNDGTGDISPVQKLVEETMENKPLDYVLAYDGDPNIGEYANASFHRTLTYGNLVTILCRMRDIYKNYGTIRTAMYETAANKKNRCNYMHDALCILFSGGTGLPSRITNGTFFRYYLFLYWLHDKLGMFESINKPTLIPCDDTTFVRAYNLGLTKKYETSTLKNVVMLTGKAQKIFGEDKAYKLYEVLNLHPDAEVKRIY